MPGKQDEKPMTQGLQPQKAREDAPQLSRFVDRETFPGDGVRTDDEVLHWARQYGGTVWHLIGTCRMGPATDKSSVVSDELRVHGLQNLRVIDASVMPSMPSANTYAATMVVAEKGSDLIRGKAALAPVSLPT
jgi:choline dehydrogenase